MADGSSAVAARASVASARETPCRIFTPTLLGVLSALFEAYDVRSWSILDSRHKLRNRCYIACAQVRGIVSVGVGDVVATR